MSFPDLDTIHFADLEASWSFFILLESNTDGFGGWKLVDTLGKPWIDLPECLQSDLISWRWLLSIARNIKRRRRDGV